MHEQGTRGRRTARGWTKRRLGLEACVLASASLVGCVDIAAGDADDFGAQSGGRSSEQGSHLSTGGRKGRDGSGGRDGSTGGAEASGGRKGRDGSGGRVGAGGRIGSGGDAASGGRASGGRDGTGGRDGAGGVGGFGGSGDPGECQYDELADACLVPIPCDPSASPFGGGLGTEVSPYLICSAAQLSAVGQTWGDRFVLARSLDLSGVVDWEPIGGWGPDAFYGTFDGAGRALVGLTIEGVGLFDEIAMASTVENLKLLDFYVSAPGGGGILAGGNAGTIMNVETSGHVEGEDYLGGIVGSHFEMFDGARSSLFNCRSSATVHGHSRIGGIAGHATTPIHRVTASGSVSGTGDYVGGVVGYLDGGYVTNSHASGDVEGHAAVGGLVGGGRPRIYGLLGGGVAYCGAGSSTASGDVTATLSAGGLVGELPGACEVVDSSATGRVSVLGGTSGSGVAGGLVGAGAGSVNRSFASGAVSSDGVAGGLVGQLTGEWVVEDVMGWDCIPGDPCPPLVQGSGKIDNSYALGDVSGGLNVGGLVGSTDHGEASAGVGSIGFSYALGTVTGGDPKGGLIGAEAAPFVVTDSYYSDLSPAVGPGTPLSAVDFANPSSFVGWTFDGSVWTMSEELGRPVLAWE